MKEGNKTIISNQKANDVGEKNGSVTGDTIFEH